jgi:DNA-directed RNA polymerase II subunit RPB3
MASQLFTDLLYMRPNKLQFHIHDIDLSIVNSMRRVLLSDIPNVGIRFDPYNETEHDVTVHVNTGCLHNEFISHRLSLIPICMHPNEITNFDKSTSQKFVINKKNATNVVMDVSTDDIMVYDHEGLLIQNHKFFPKDYITGAPILITKLKPNLFKKEFGDELYLEAYATIGTAKDNAAWSPVSMACFYNVVDDVAAKAAFDVKFKDVTDPEKLKEANDRFNVLEKYQHFQKNNFGEPNHFIFTIESECAMTPNYLACKALVILCDKLRTLKESIAGANEEHVRIQPINEHMHQLLLSQETHTLGNLLQAQLYNKYIRANKASELEYVGYLCPHPLEKTIIVKLKFAKGFITSDDVLVAWLIDAIDGIYNDLLQITKEWINYSNVNVSEFNDIDAFINHIA